MKKSLEQIIIQAIQSEGEQAVANEAYFTFLKSELFLPIEKGSLDDPRVLFLEEGDSIFLPVFSSEENLKSWAQESFDKIELYCLKGTEILTGLGDNVTLVFNPGTPSYKEFNPDEILKLKTIVSKIKQLMD